MKVLWYSEQDKDNSLADLETYNQITILHVSFQTTELPALPTSLQELMCHSNQLTSLPPLPKSLLQLHCYDNQLTSLPPLPKSLERLRCNHNQLTSLPPLLKSLLQLHCHNNQLTSLPPLPGSLQTLFCRNNQLTCLSSLPESLRWLSCCNNQLTSLPSLPESLRWLICHNNQFTSLPPPKQTSDIQITIKEDDVWRYLLSDVEIDEMYDYSALIHFINGINMTQILEPFREEMSRRQYVAITDRLKEIKTEIQKLCAIAKPLVLTL